MIELKDIVQEYPATDGSGGVVRIVDGVNITYDKPSINFIVGPSGCGKTTLLRMMGGVRPYTVQTPTSGDVLIDGQPCFGPHPDAVTVFQKLANLPFLTVQQNIEYPFGLALWDGRVPAEEQAERVKWILDKVGLADRATNRPSQLSGGQNQRVALASALVLKPRILLMDEPFRGLDAKTLREVQDLLIDLWEEIQCVVVFVGHDIEEALMIADRITVLSTKPATVAKEFYITQPRKLRTDTWFQTTEVQAMEGEILHLLSRG